MDLDAVRSLVQREIGAQNLTIKEEPRAAGGDLGDQLLTARTVAQVLELMAAKGPDSLTIDDVALACRRIVMRVSTITDVVVEDWRFSRFLKWARMVIARSEMEPHHVSTLLWAIATVKESLPEFQDFLPEVCTAVEHALPEMNVQNLTSCWTSAAKLRSRNVEVLEIIDPLLDEIVKRASSIEDTQISWIMWAAGEMDLPEERTYELTGALLRDLTPERLDSFQSRELANLVWGLANLGQRDTGLLTAVADIVGTSVMQMPAKEASLDLPMIVCGFKRLMYHDDDFLDVVARRLLKKNALRKMSSWGLCALAWAWPNFGDDIRHSSVRTIRDVIDQQLERRRLTSADVEHSIRGPSQWMSRE